VNTGEKDTLDQQTGDEDVGDIPPRPASGDPPPEAHARPREEPLKVTVKRRLEAEGRWAGRIELERNDMMRLARKRGMSKVDAQLWVYGELDRLYPASQKTPEQTTEKGTLSHSSTQSGDGQTPVHADSGQIQGLGDIPASWGTLPANASIQAEIGWVQANRLVVVDERSGATAVHLDRAYEPAPSRAAIGWLETSIRAYSKYCDIAAKATQTQEHEAEAVRRERLALADVLGLLSDMGTPAP